MTLNILLSFAQYERELIGERVRDKVAASRARGMWMGGPVPLGYRVENRKLLVDEAGAATVRRVFEGFAEIGSATKLLPVLHADLSKVSAINLEKLPDGFRLQRLIFQAARKGFATLRGSFEGSESLLVMQLIRLVEDFLQSGRLDIPSLFHSDPLRRRILIALNIDHVVQHLIGGIVSQNTTKLTPVYDEEQPIGATGLMRVWYTTKPNALTTRSHVSHVVGDSSWEQYAANIFEKHPSIIAYVKNDHLGFQVHYMWGGSRRRYLPDFLVRFASGKMLALEIKGEDSPQNKAKRAALDEWVTAVNGEGGFGSWAWDVVFEPAQVHDIVGRHAT